jgi:hypothetical protein
LRDNLKERLAKDAPPIPAKEPAKKTVAEPSNRVKRNLAFGLRLVVGWKEPLAIFVGWRLGLGALAFLAGILLPGLARGGTAPYTPANLGSFGERLLGVWSHWDGEWFLYVAQVGYRPGEFTSPFFPLYPVLVRGLAVIFGNYLLAGVLLSAGLSLAVFVLMYLLVSHEAGERVGKRAALYLAVFPTSFFLAACYSESLFLALSLGAFLAVRRYSNWWLAGLLIGLAALTRNLGILLLLPLGWEWLVQHRQALVKPASGKGWRLELDRLNWQPLATLAFILLPLAFIGSWLLFNGLALADPLNFMTVQNNPVWNRHSSLPWQTVAHAFEIFINNFSAPAAVGPVYREDPNLLDLLFWLFLAVTFLVVAFQVWKKRLAFAYLIYFGLAWLLPLFSPAAKEPLLSYPRFALLVFPAFIGLALLGERWRALHYIYLFGATLLLGLLFARFANWYWVA